MNKQEKQARQICAWGNWVKHCSECRFNWRICHAWEGNVYTTNLWRRFLCLIGKHKWLMRRSERITEQLCLYCLKVKVVE